MMINSALAMNPPSTTREGDQGKIDDGLSRPGAPTELPGAGATPSPELIPMPPELPGEKDLEDHRQRFEEVLGIDFKMKFRLHQRGDGEDTRIGFKFKMKAHARVDDFSVKMKQQIRGHVRMNGDQENAVDRLDAHFKLELKVRIDGSGEDAEGAAKIAELVESFAAIFQGFLEGIAGVLGGRPAEQDEIVAPAIEDDPATAAPTEAVVVETPANEDQEAVAVGEELQPAEPTVLEAPAEQEPTSPLADLFHRLAEMFRDLSQDLVGILAGIGEHDEADDDSAERPESFRMRASFHAHFAYQQVAEPDAESRFIAQA